MPDPAAELARPSAPRHAGVHTQTPPRTAPSCATSLTGASRSSRAIRASCKVAGIARGQQSAQHIALRLFPHQPRVENRLHQLFDKERNAVGFGHDLLHHLGGQGLPLSPARPSLRPGGASGGRGRVGSHRNGAPRAAGNSGRHVRTMRRRVVGTWSSSSPSSSRVDGSAQCRSSHTARTGCCTVSASSQATSTSCVCCFWRCGHRVSGGY